MAPAKHHDDGVLGRIGKDLGTAATILSPVGTAVHVAGGVGNAVHDVTKVPGALATGVKDVAEFQLALLKPNTWIRVAEVVVGVVCIAVGLSAMTKSNPVGKAAKAGATAAVL